MMGGAFCSRTLDGVHGIHGWPSRASGCNVRFAWAWKGGSFIVMMMILYVAMCYE
jgi:hypothetical protein